MSGGLSRRRPTAAERVEKLRIFSIEDIMEIAVRVQSAPDPFRAATLVSVAEVLALTEVVVRVDAAAMWHLGRGRQ
ncbi:MAG: hypothetical protein O3C09_04930 [Proteobacteria bacterium]|nr:hypothetical protein [Pseudomonadota bacterium]